MQRDIESSGGQLLSDFFLQYEENVTFSLILSLNNDLSYFSKNISVSVTQCSSKLRKPRCLSHLH